MTRTIYPALYGDENIYSGLNADDWPSDNHGWNDHEDSFHRLAANASMVVEVGTWKGRSALALARACPNAEIVCIDTWQGSPEMWLDRYDSTRYGALRMRHGVPQLAFEFLANVVRAGLQERITPLCAPSSVGLEILRRLDARPDLVFLDGSHEEEAVWSDIRAAQRLSPQFICGDDYDVGSWPGVVNAVNRLLPNASKNEACFWWVER